MKEDGSYYVVSANEASSVTCNDPATKARENILQFCEFKKLVDSKPDINQNEVQIIKNLGSKHRRCKVFRLNRTARRCLL